jgi:hypothetical protein
MSKGKLSNHARKVIEAAVEQLFERAKARLLGPDPRKRYALGGKRLAFSYVPQLTFGGLYDAVSREHSVKGETDTLAGVLKVAGGYLDAVKERTKARVTKEVESFVQDAPRAVKTDHSTVLAGKLAELWGDIHADVKRIVETEAQTVKSFGTFEAIGKIGAMTGNHDPNCFFIVVRDGLRCKECTRLHLMDDGITPRVWKMSDLGSGYHKKGQETPKINGLHPHCRCVLSSLQSGYGFDKSGKVTYIKPGHDEYEAQHGMSKSEGFDSFEPLEKMRRVDFANLARRFGWSGFLRPGHPQGLASHPSVRWVGNGTATENMPSPVISVGIGHGTDIDKNAMAEIAGQLGLRWSRPQQDFCEPDPDHAHFPVYVAHGYAKAPVVPLAYPWKHASQEFDVDQVVYDPNLHTDPNLERLFSEHKRAETQRLLSPTAATIPNHDRPSAPVTVEQPEGYLERLGDGKDRVHLDKGHDTLRYFKQAGGVKVPIKILGEL